jgi:hypothetical protein
MTVSQQGAAQNIERAPMLKSQAGGYPGVTHVAVALRAWF